MRDRQNSFVADRHPRSERETFEKVDRYSLELNDMLEDEAQDLKRRGFPVDSDGRINPAMTNLMPSDQLRGHDNQVALEEARWEERRQKLGDREGLDEEQSRKLGELLEMTKTLSINKLWFGKRLVSVRTSRYDDYTHGVDNLILDKETGQAIAAIDEATAGGLGKKNKDRVRSKIENGVEVTYGVKIDTETNAISPHTYENLPVFLISTDGESLLKLAEDLRQNRFTEREIVHEILEQLREQAYDAAYGDPEDDRRSARRHDRHRRVPKVQQVLNPALRAAYERASKIFESLRA